MRRSVAVSKCARPWDASAVPRSGLCPQRDSRSSFTRLLPAVIRLMPELFNVLRLVLSHTAALRCSVQVRPDSTNRRILLERSDFDFRISQGCGQPTVLSPTPNGKKRMNRKVTERVYRALARGNDITAGLRPVAPTTALRADATMAGVPAGRDAVRLPLMRTGSRHRNTRGGQGLLPLYPDRSSRWTSAPAGAGTHWESSVGHGGSSWKSQIVWNSA